MSPTNPHASLLETLMKIILFHLQQLHFHPQHLLHNKQQMLAILQNRFSLSHSHPNKEEGVSVDKSDPTHRIHPSSTSASGGPIHDSVFFKDSVAQSRVANNKSLIDIVHAYFLQAGKNKEAEEYLKMVSHVSVLQNLESVELWNYQTLPFKVYEGLEEMGFGESPLRFGPPPQFFPTPEELGWKPGQADVDSNNRGGCLADLTESFATDDGGITAEVEVDGASTTVEAGPAGVVVDIGEVIAQPVMDGAAAAGEGNKKKWVMEMEDID